MKEPKSIDRGGSITGISVICKGVNMRDLLKDYRKICEEIPLFEGIRGEDLLSLFECLRAFIKTYEKEEYIVLYNDSVECVGVLLEGTVHMIKEDLRGNKSILAPIEERELFGETFACGADLTSTVAFVATTPVKVLFVHFDKVMHACSRSCIFHHRLIENMISLIARKNALLVEKLDITSKRTIREKITAFLTIQAQKKKSTSFTIALGRLELADYLCTDRSALTRELNNMKRAGLIDFEKNNFTLLESFYE
ncbi:Crp/Fnr family transcriptional regulator [Anaerocolumna sp. AGMB13020]|uniref:Crp/Fnr family transcriptional regulator n=1 Tax=Anaerocolumna sp. AGMB13020 TaxID=3081750 RepID=UPI002953B327|nr:Crp/Fnr family transcriptional regulator [Anaerocolumna sp. AGMB13020]WOO34854.1 Crp/Fnr family transcriptional regulator [Anaerocolumna sp. AGMB13020]